MSEVDFNELGDPSEWELGAVAHNGGRGALRRTNRREAWASVEFKIIRSGQPRPYADSVLELLTTFRGGSPSAIRGWELPFATRPPYSDGPQAGKQVFDKFSSDPDPWASRRRAHTDRIKGLIRPFYGWGVDLTVGEKRQMGASWLDSFTCIEQERFSTTYRLVIVSPWMD